MRIYINRFIQGMVLLTTAFVCHRNLDAAPVQILINHPGYDTQGHKSLVVQSAEEMEPARFEVTDSEGRAAFEGMLHKTGAVAGLCPITEANLGDGIFPGLRFLNAGGRIGTGTDSNILIDPAQELRGLEYSQRLAHQGRNMLASDTHASVARRLFGATLAGGAQAMGIKHGLAVGHPADFVTLDASHPALHGRMGDQLLDNWIFAARNTCIDTVWKRGKKLVSAGRHMDGARVTARYLKVVDRIMAE